MDKSELGITQPKEQAIGGAHEGSSRTSQDLALWNASPLSADRDLLPEKRVLDARTRDLLRNDGLSSGAVHVHRDGIVGGAFKLNARPDWKTLGATEDWAREFQQAAESQFTLFAESDNNWLDAAGINTLTGLVRLAITGYLQYGEVLATAEWLRSERRPFRTAIQMIDPDRLSNPNEVMDTRFLRRGIERDQFGRPTHYHIRMAHPTDWDSSQSWRWKRVAVAKPWGRKQVIHIFEQARVAQSRGVSDLVSALKEMRMTKKFRDITLQSAVVSATFAAAIESDLPPAEAYEALGLSTMSEAATQQLAGIAQYTGGSRNLHIDGAKIPHLYPGTKLHVSPVGTPGGVGTTYEESLLRNIASSLGLSYEQFSRDFTKTNYSSARASMGETWKFMQSRKKMVADRFATAIYSLWLEEAVNSGELPLPGDSINFYDGINKEAFCRCDWIGASRGQIDELKETQAAMLRIRSGLSTYEKEMARMGEDFREVFEQRKREEAMIMEMGLNFSLDTNAKGSADTGDTTPTQHVGDEQDAETEAGDQPVDRDKDGVINE